MELFDAAAAYMGDVEVEALTIGDSVAWASVETFEGTLKLTEGATAEFTVETPGRFGSPKSLLRGAAVTHRCLAAPTVYFPWSGPGRRIFRGYVQLIGPTSPTLGGLALKAVGSVSAGFQFLLDSRSLSGGSAPAQIRLDAGTTPLASAKFVGNGGTSLDTTYRVDVEWNASAPNLRARYYTASGDLLVELTANTTSYAAAGLQFGVYGYNPVAYDDLAILYTA